MLNFFKVFFVLLFVFTLSLSAQDQNLEELAKDSETEMRIKNADLEALVYIFSKKTKRNYILDERVKGTVSIYLPGKVTAEEAIYILDAVLALKGFTTVPIGDNLWKIIPAQEAKQTTVPIVDDIEGRGTASVVTRFVNLKYVSADDVKELISSLVSSYGLISAYTGTNSLILIDSEDNIQRLMKIINYLDLPSSDSEMTIIPIEHAEAPELAEKINEILKDDDDSKSDIPSVDQDRRTAARQAARNVAKTAAAQKSTSATSLTVAMRSKDPKIIADERTNSIIVVADEDTTLRIRALVDQLDSPLDLSGNRFHVYRCQHADAEEIAEVLSGLVGGEGSSSSSSSSSNTGSRARGDRVERTQDRLSRNNRTPGRSRSETPSSSNNGGITSVSLGEDVSITADPATNSLVISAGRSDYEKILQLLKELDIKRRQVIVEALILEVGIDDLLSLGTEFSSSAGGDDGGILATNTTGDLAALFTNPQQLQDFTIAAASAGTLTLPNDVTIPTQSVLVRAAQNTTNVNVLSAPNILATDNEEAEIVVGRNVPFIASTASNQTDLNNVFNQVDRQDVGITLRITPQISSSDFVTLRMFTEVSNIIQGTENSELGPSTTIRTSETVVITKDSQMIVIGGLMSDNIETSDRGVPFFKDIPLIGSLFRTVSETQRRTNLLIFLTPRIIKDQFDARDVSLDERDGMKEVIESYKIYPDRHEQLVNDDFDNVIDGQLYEGEKPTTVRPGKKKVNEQEIEILELEPLAAVKKSRPIENKSSGQFVVFEMIDDLPQGVWPQFLSENSAGLVGILVPESTSQFAKEFFQSDQVYLYSNGDNSVSLEVAGIFDNVTNAENYFPSLKKQWYRLSPHEILNLGQGPWRSDG